MIKYKGILNYFGEVHEFFTFATSNFLAEKNIINRFAKGKGLSVYQVRQHLLSGDKIKIVEVNENNPTLIKRTVS